jgi:hypothetical protein
MTPGLLFKPFKTRLRGMYIGGYIPIGWSNIKIAGYRELIGSSSRDAFRESDSIQSFSLG